MKRYLITAISLIFILCLSACTLGKALPSSVTIDKKEYKKCFVGELYPVDEDFLDTNSYYKYSKTQFDCRIAYDNNAEPNIYFESEQFDDAVFHYTVAENFDFFCLKGNIHDENEQQIYEIQEIDSSMFDKLLEFSKNNDYNPLAPFNTEENLKKVPVSDADNWTADEIHFYKESKDGAFTSSKGYTFVLHENKLYLLYQYDFSDTTSPVMLIEAVPTEISDYFCSLLNALQSK